MKKNLVVLTLIITAILVGSLAFAAQVTTVSKVPAPMTTGEIIQMILTGLFTAAMAWLEPKARAYFSKLDAEAEIRIKAIENERIRGRLDAGRVELRKAGEGAFSEFLLGLTTEQAKDGIISGNDIKAISIKAVESFVKASTNSTSDLMKGLGMDLYECAEQEVKDIAARIKDRFRPAVAGKVS